MGQFVHLHLHSCYSLLDGACRIDELLDDAARMGMPAMALTDHGVLYGAVEFYEKARTRGINPIIGCEIYVAPRSRFDRTPKLDDNPHHLIVLAQDDEGYRNLLRLVSLASLEGFYYRPRVDKDLLARHAKGLIGLSACLAGEVPETILKSDLRKAKEAAGIYRDIFGKGNFYLEIQDHDLALQKEVNRGLLEIARDLDLPLVGTNDVHYTKKSHAEAHDVLLCIQTGKKVEEKNRLRFETEEFYLKSFEELEPRFREFPDAMRNTLEIAERCRLKLPIGEQFLLPQYPLPEGTDEKKCLKDLCLEGLRRRYPEPTEKIMVRLDHELSIINSMGFADYFLIVWDFIRHAKEQNIPVGPGRGSVAGSLVAYLLGITEVDPLKYDLIFERFLNPGRKKMPDIDTDFCDLRRDEMIRYVVEKYGKERVAQIVTFGTLRARAAVRDAGRVLSLPIPEVDRVAKLIPPKATVREAKELPEIQALIQEKPFVQGLVDTAEKIEGLPRNASIHAAGVVIAKDSLLDHVAVQKMQGEAVVCQYEMGALEKVGLLKMDFLGLRTLTVLDETLKLLEETQGVRLKLEEIPLEDKKAFRLLSEAGTVGVFQLESSLAQQILRDYKPDRFSDLIAVVALNRPGPLQSGMVSEFIKARHGKTKIKYPHPDLEPILKETYGIFLYQEQVMQTAMVMAGFTTIESDGLREAMGKKKVDLMARYRERFVKESVARGYDEKRAQSIWETMAKFAEYGFNKSHSAAYGLVSYWTAYLKANVPVEFLAATLTSVGDKIEKVGVMINECRRMGIEVLPPDVNESVTHFAVVDRKIRFGLGAIKNVGEKAIENVVEVRKEGGKFTSLSDFCRRVDLRSVNRKVLESLIKAGAMDSFGWGRAKLLANLDEAMEYAVSVQKEKISGQTSFFSSYAEVLLAEPKPLEAEEFPKEKLLVLEREVLGLYISTHPLAEKQGELARLGVTAIGELARHAGPEPVAVAGIVLGVKRILTKNNQPMAFVTLEDPTGSVEGVVFSKVFERHAGLIRDEALVVLKGKASVKELDALEDEEPGVEVKMTVDEIVPLAQFLESRVPAPADTSRGSLACHIAIDLSVCSTDVLPRLKALLENGHGNVPVFLEVKSSSGTSRVALPPSYFVKDVPSVAQKFFDNFGSAVRVELKGAEGEKGTGEGDPWKTAQKTR